MFKRLLVAFGFGSVPAVVFAAGTYLDAATLEAYGMPVSLGALGVVLVGMFELSRAPA